MVYCLTLYIFDTLPKHALAKVYFDVLQSTKVHWKSVKSYAETFIYELSSRYPSFKWYV